MATTHSQKPGMRPSPVEMGTAATGAPNSGTQMGSAATVFMATSRRVMPVTWLSCSSIPGSAAVSDRTSASVNLVIVRLLRGPPHHIPATRSPSSAAAARTASSTRRRTSSTVSPAAMRVATQEDAPAL